ncbi:hypothetical protein [Maritimibacter sp. UBA3975]|uniref:hypothetical protein n=1 Tax=Maritimibacter sp. UBA3975 TaxID=1946833 RepID=UPI000C099F5B|nr:hypothetical protein [Maritimibacter sp. UBA3975]MAM61112.1 hypothetical protein [Maritimibacter sp.]|tara:strand:- start:173 stop:655 length:483 start_codon:yes stop_codon:yes gene_type:complete
MKRKLALAFAGGVLAPAAMAGEFCVLDEGVRFACTLDGGAKAVEVCDMIEADGARASYGYFTPGAAPELTLEVDMASVHYEPWNGMGGTIWETVKFFADDGVHAYEVWYSGDRDAGEEVAGGLNVYSGNDMIASKDCDAGSLTHDIPALIDAVETAQISP